MHMIQNFYVKTSSVKSFHPIPVLKPPKKVGATSFVFF